MLSCRAHPRRQPLRCLAPTPPAAPLPPIHAASRCLASFLSFLSRYLLSARAPLPYPTRLGQDVEEQGPSKEPAILSVKGRGFNVDIFYVEEPVSDYILAAVSTVLSRFRRERMLPMIDSEKQNFKPSISYLSPKELELVRKALNLAFEAHDGQKRRSGEPFIINQV